MSNLIIGIDPDLEKSGVATLANKNLQLKTLTLTELIDYLVSVKADVKKVVIEAGWLNKSVWHLPNSLQKMSSSQAHKIGSETGRRVGMNHATGQNIAQICEYMGFVVLLVQPTTRKLDAERFKKLTKYASRTNQEARDAAMLVWGMN